MSLKLSKNFIGHWIVLSIFFVFFFQMVNDLIESIYTMDLLNTTLDEKILGIIFFFTTPILLIFRKKIPDQLIKIVGVAAIVFRMMEPFFRTPMKIWIAGLSVGCILVYLPVYILKMNGNNKIVMGFLFSLCLTSSSLILILFKTINSSVDISMVGFFQSIGWALGITAIVFMFLPERNIDHDLIEEDLKAVKDSLGTRSKNRTLLSITGLFGIIILLYFVYNSPVVFTRWFEINYLGAVCTLSVVYFAFIITILWIPQILFQLKKIYLWIWNLVFFISLIGMILLNQTTFIRDNTLQVVMVYPTPFYIQILTYFNLILSPILFLDIFIFMHNLYRTPIRKGRLVGSFLLNEFLMIILIFALIFSNVWGYVAPISTYFRGLIWLPFAWIGLLFVILLGLPELSCGGINFKIHRKSFKSSISAVFLIAILMNGVWAYMTLPHPQQISGMGATSLKIMTYNIQQGVNSTGDKNFDAQLAVIQQINPDIIGLQESDTSKINTGNTDVVGYFAKKLDYYIYYGPKSVMQTYGCAILSRYPIQNYFSFYTYGDEDEIGSVFCEIIVRTRVFNVFVNHPAGSGDSKLAHTVAMLNLASPKENVILLGDFNWRENTVYYSMINVTYLDTWRTRWPTGIDDEGLVMTSTIDHIFVSNTFTVIDARYIPNPESQTDHPAYWAEISW